MSILAWVIPLNAASCLRPGASWAGFWRPGVSWVGFWASWRLLGWILASWRLLGWIFRVPMLLTIPSSLQKKRIFLQTPPSKCFAGYTLVNTMRSYTTTFHQNVDSRLGFSIKRRFPFFVQRGPKSGPPLQMLCWLPFGEHNACVYDHFPSKCRFSLGFFH